MKATYRASLALALFLPFSILAEGGHDIGNGGNGVWQQRVDEDSPLEFNKVYLRDLYDAGPEVARRPFYVARGTYSPRDHLRFGQIRRRLIAKIAPNRPPRFWLDSTYNFLAKKITMIYKRSPVIGSLILQGIEHFDWHWHDGAVASVENHDQTVQLLPSQSLVTLGIRSGRSIYSSILHLSRTWGPNRAAYFIHEALMPFTRVVPCVGSRWRRSRACNEYPDGARYRLDAQQVRRFVGYVHSPAFAEATGSDLRERLRLSFINPPAANVGSGTIIGAHLDANPQQRQQTASITHRLFRAVENDISIELSLDRPHGAPILGYMVSRTQSLDLVRRQRSNLAYLPRRRGSNKILGIENLCVGEEVGFSRWPGFSAEQEETIYVRATRMSLRIIPDGPYEGRGVIQLYDPIRSVSFAGADECISTLDDYFETELEVDDY